MNLRQRVLAVTFCVILPLGIAAPVAGHALYDEFYRKPVHAVVQVDESVPMFSGGGASGTVTGFVTTTGSSTNGLMFGTTTTIGTIALGGYSVQTIGIIDQNCVPRRDPKELMVAHESPEQVVARAKSSAEQIAAN